MIINSLDKTTNRSSCKLSDTLSKKATLFAAVRFTMEAKHLPVTRL